MERLTEYVTENCSKPFYRFRSDGEIDIRYRYCINIEKAINKLAEYENTGLEPKEVDKLKSELEELKKNAIIRPAKYKAKLGTTYWFICDDGDILDIQADSQLITNIRWKFGNMFATCEEAEEALKKLEEK